MKNIFKKSLLTLAIILASLTTIQITSSSSAYAEHELGKCNDYLLGMPSWDCGIESNPQSQDDITSNIIIIASNVFTAITIASAYLVLGFVIYGGYLYMFASGDPSKAAASRKVLTRAFVGLAIVLLSNIILNAIRFALIRDQSLTAINQNINPNEVFRHAIDWVIGISGAVSLIFIVIGAVGYITSSGDSSKLQKAKNTLTYALIGLAIVVLSAVITAFVSNLIRDAESNTGYINQTIIAKELHEK